MLHCFPHSTNSVIFLKSSKRVISTFQTLQPNQFSQKATIQFVTSYQMRRNENWKSKCTHSMRTLEALSETNRVRLSCTQVRAALSDELRLRSIELGMPTVTWMFEPESDCRTSGLASKSFTLVMPLDFSSSTTFCGGRGWDEAVPQFTPMAEVVDREIRSESRRMGKDLRVWDAIVREEYWCFTVV